MDSRGGAFGLGSIVEARRRCALPTGDLVFSTVLVGAIAARVTGMICAILSK